MLEAASAEEEAADDPAWREDAATADQEDEGMEDAFPEPIVCQLCADTKQLRNRKYHTPYSFELHMKQIHSGGAEGKVVCDSSKADGQHKKTASNAKLQPGQQAGLSPTCHPRHTLH